MEREQYLQYRNTNSAQPLYEYYKENHKGGIFLEMKEFFQVIQQWPFMMQAFTNVTREYDERFVVMTVSNVKTGQTLKYL